MSRFKEIFTIEGTFKLHGLPVYFASITLQYDENDPHTVRCIGARFLRKRLRKWVGLEDEAYAGEKLLMMLNGENSFVRLAWEHYSDRVEYQKDLAELNRDYYATRGI